jgi:hypothetical protein
LEIISYYGSTIGAGAACWPPKAVIFVGSEPDTVTYLNLLVRSYSRDPQHGDAARLIDIKVVVVLFFFSPDFVKDSSQEIFEEDF